MPKRTTDYRSTLLDALKDPVEAAHYLSSALNDSEDMFLVALRDVAEAGQMARVAAGAGIARESLYRMLSPSGNPTYRNLISIFRALGIEFSQVRSRSSKTTPRPRPLTSHISPGVRPARKRIVKTRQRIARSATERRRQ